MKQPPVVVVGAGWAGLAAAVELARAGVPVQLFESARQVGGRARTAPFGTTAVDNGQHLLLGAYRETLRLMERVGAPPAALLRLPFDLRIDEPGGTDLQLKAPPLPAPLHLAGALLLGRGLDTGERVHALRLGWRLARGLAAGADETVSALLDRERQPASLQRRVWAPLCLAALNTPPGRASAQAFLAVLRDAFLHRRADSDLLVPRLPLGQLFPQPAVDYIERHGGSVLLGQRATALTAKGGRIAGVQVGNRTFPASALVLATPSHITRRLLAPHPQAGPACLRMAGLKDEPITTVYLRYPHAVGLGRPLLGLVGPLSQWVFDHGPLGRPGIVAVTISAGGDHMGLHRTALAERVAGELAGLFPDWPAPRASLVIRERRATFACEAGVAGHRPPAASGLAGCWLAGDYVAGDYPATLEGAVRSGVQCARHIVDNAQPPSQVMPSHPHEHRSEAVPTPS